MTSMSGVLEAFKAMLGDSKVSGECFEVGHNGGFTIKPPPEYSDETSRKSLELISQNGEKWHEVIEV